MDEFTYLADLSSLLQLVGVSTSRVRTRDLTRIAKTNRLRIPDAVAREARRKEDRLKSWIDRNPSFIQRSTDQNVAELMRLSQTYPGFLGAKVGAADLIVVAMGVFYRRSDWVVLTDDVGIQAVCVLESIHYVSASVFRRLEGI